MGISFIHMHTLDHLHVNKTNSHMEGFICSGPRFETEADNLLVDFRVALPCPALPCPALPCPALPCMPICLYDKEPVSYLLIILVVSPLSYLA